MKKRQIHSQGDFDGACLIYAAANAIYALSGRKLTAARWSRALAHVQDPRDYLDAQVGSTRVSRSAEREIEFVRDLIKELDSAAEYTCEGVESLDSTDAKQLSTLITRKSVLLVSNDAHWYCIVEANSEQAFLACSAQLNELSQNYTEIETPNLRRIANQSIKYEELLPFYKRRAISIQSQ